MRQSLGVILIYSRTMSAELPHSTRILFLEGRADDDDGGGGTEVGLDCIR